MIKVIAPCTVTAGTINKALEIYKMLIEETVKEKGCIKYELFQQIDDPYKLTLIEEWESEECLLAHTKTQHFQTLVPELAKYEVESPVLIYNKLM